MTGVVTHLVVAKAPVPGLAKTRLTAVVTPEQAAGLAAAALLDTLEAAAAAQAAVGGRPVVALTGDLDLAARAPELRDALRRFVVVPQRGADFAARLAAAHADAAQVGGGAVVQIGMDTPQVTSDLLAAAAGQLAAGSDDVLLGAADDGGWWVLASAAPRWAQALVEVPMSQDDTGSLTRQALLAVGARVGELPQLRDVDTWSDALAVAAAHPHGRFGTAMTVLSSACAVAS